MKVGSGLTDSTSPAATVSEIEAGAPTLQSYTVDANGNVVASMSNAIRFNVGRVLLQSFNDPSALEKQGNNLYNGFAAAGPVGGSVLSSANNSPGSNGLGRISPARSNFRTSI